MSEKMPEYAKEITFGIKFLTVEENQRSLEHLNKENRPCKQARVKRYAEDILADRWFITGEPIIYDENNQLLNGQHRMMASVLANKGFWSVVIRNVPRLAFSKIDTGMVRTAGDVLAMDGDNDCNSNMLASAIRIARNLSCGLSSANSAVPMTNQEVIDWLAENDGIRESMRFGTTFRMAGKMVGGPSLIVALHYLFSKLDAKAAESFFIELDSGEDIGRGHPIALLRNTLIREILGSQSRPPRRWVIAICIKTWNLVRSGRTVSVLKFASTESFPKIT